MMIMVLVIIRRAGIPVWLLSELDYPSNKWVNASVFLWR